MNKFPVSPKKAAIILCATAAVLAAASLIGQHYKINGGDDLFLLKIADKFDLDQEKNNLPTWFQSSTLLLSALLLAVVGYVRREFRDADARFWGLLAGIFCYLSLDESVAIHEQVSVPLREAFHLHGLFFFSWIIPAAIAVFILFSLLFKFLRRLPANVRRAFIFAGIVYVGGALGMEMLGANYYEARIEPFGSAIDFNYALLTTFEELLEMTGVAVFISALLSHLSSEALYVPVVMTEENSAESRAEILSFGKSVASAGK